MATMVEIPGGTFDLGANRPGRQPVTVTVSSFFMSDTAVPLAEWVLLRDEANGVGYSIPSVGFADGANHPVQGISVLDAVAWCNALSEKNSRTPRYRLQADNSPYRGGLPTSKLVIVPGNGFRIPLEKEWELVAREGGVLSGTDLGSGSVNWNIAWPWTINALEPNPLNRTVYTFGPPQTVQVNAGVANSLGIWHLVGNTFEYVEHFIKDAKGEYGDDVPSTRYVVIRGGSCQSLGEVARPNTRDVCNVLFRLPLIGFRVARD